MAATDTDLLYLFPVIAISVWWTVMFFLSRFGGWSVLAEAYATDEDFDGAKAHLQSLSFTRFGLPANYNNIVTVGADASALRLSTYLLFRPFHPPLKIPFADITVETKKALIFETAQLCASRAPGVRIGISKSRAAWIAGASSGALRYGA